MSEIKSTMEMVLARAEKMAAEAQIDMMGEDIAKQGMKVGARFLQGDSIDIDTEIASIQPSYHYDFFSGLINSYLRQLNLPREEEPDFQRAIQGILEAAPKRKIQAPLNQLENVLNELLSILHRFNEHKQQLRNQVEESFQMQIGQLEDQLAQQTGMQYKMSPDQHPKFQEEWGRILGELNEQYGNAVSQYHKGIRQLLELKSG